MNEDEITNAFIYSMDDIKHEIIGCRTKELNVQN